MENALNNEVVASLTLIEVVSMAYIAIEAMNPDITRGPDFEEANARDRFYGICERLLETVCKNADSLKYINEFHPNLLGYYAMESGGGHNTQGE